MNGTELKLTAGKRKAKPLFLMRILLEETDEAHPLTMEQILARLNLIGIEAERKSVYQDMALLRAFGLDICTRIDTTTGYFIGQREFELPEVKLLIDTVQASRFLTERKSRALIQKIGKLCSVHEAKSLGRQVHVTGRIKNMNESIYFNVDALHNAIARDRQVSFRYIQHILAGKKHYRRNGEIYSVSPFALTCDSENYYLIAYDAATCRLKHYRVDKMESIDLCDAKREGKAQFAQVDMARHNSRNFSMYGGEQRQVSIRFSAHLLGTVIDKFGTGVPIERVGDTHFIARARVAISPPFFGWLFSLDGDAVVTEPSDIADLMRKRLAQAAALY